MREDNNMEGSVFMRLAQTGDALGAAGMGKRPGVWSRDLGGGWRVDVNPHAEPGFDVDGVTVPPHMAAVTCNGIPVVLEQLVAEGYAQVVTGDLAEALDAIDRAARKAVTP